MYDLPTWRGSIEPQKFGRLSWSDHIPFAFDLVAALRPAVIVELGTHSGESYFAFCQAVHENKTDSRSYAVDLWQGDEHAGRYGEEVFQSVTRHNARHYTDFSQLLRESFDVAARQFSEGSIDLLHIDGLHTLEAVRHDFQQWAPKVRSGGVILLHDTAVRSEGFGVWRLWEELARGGAGASFEFHHGFGLGVLAKDGVVGENPFLQSLFRGSAADGVMLRAHYCEAARELRRRLQRSSTLDVASAQIYFAAGGQPHSEDNSVAIEVPPRVRQTVRLRLPMDFFGGVVRVDPMRCPGIIDLYAIRILGPADDQPVWSASDPGALAALTVAGTASATVRGKAWRIFSTGDDPHVILPPILADAAALPLRVELDLCLQPMTAETACAAWQSRAFHDASPES